MCDYGPAELALLAKTRWSRFASRDQHLPFSFFGAFLGGFTERVLGLAHSHLRPSLPLGFLKEPRFSRRSRPDCYLRTHTHHLANDGPVPTTALPSKIFLTNLAFGGSPPHTLSGSGQLRGYLPSLRIPNLSNLPSSQHLPTSRPLPQPKGLSRCLGPPHTQNFPLWLKFLFYQNGSRLDSKRTRAHLPLGGQFETCMPKLFDPNKT
ncbi:hypothetical protein B0H63DRAFT_69223 [Podospora didyma]|uniref:Uncharacterized protein n=1 Tax=Podospora didyma TaxID=330526 RepID=A0AAE0K143_9PEZI|nr:hypothetical protein B0H63DRAFT_69223 [Podospora didyma]